MTETWWALPGGHTAELRADQPPVAADNYQPSRQQMRHFKRFMGADNHASLNGWTSTAQHIDKFIRSKLSILVARSREQGRDNDYAIKFLSLLEANVVGENGIRVLSQVKRGNELDRAANQTIDTGWDDWCANFCDAQGMLDLIDIEQLLIRSQGTDGEFIAIEHRGSAAGEYAYQLELVDAQLLDITYSAEAKNSKRVIRHGIEYDASKRAVAYYFRELDVWGNYLQGKRRRVSADVVIHVFLPKWINQNRGIPWMASALFRMKMLGGYEEAAITAARVGASKHGFLAGGKEGVNYDEEDEKGNKYLNLDEPGGFEEVGEDFMLHTYDPSYPHEQFPEFMARALRGIGSGLLTQYETLANDREGVNFSSLRDGKLDQQMVWKLMQSFVIRRFLKRVRRNWLEMALLSGKLKIGDKALSRSLLDYLPAMYLGPRWEWVDPAKEAVGNEKSYNLRTTSVSALIRKSGRNPDDVFQEIADENEKMLALGIKPPNDAVFSQEFPKDEEQGKPNGDKDDSKDTDA